MGELLSFDVDRLDQVLYQLIFHHSFRGAFLKGEYDRLGLSVAAVSQLQSVEGEELNRLAEQVCREVFRGSAELPGGLRLSYPTTLTNLARMGHDSQSIAHSFLESSYFQDSRDVPFAGVGITTEEAFYEFLCNYPAFLNGAPINPALAQHEFLVAIMSILVVNDDPAFEVRSPLVRHNGFIHFAIAEYSVEVLEALGATATTSPNCMRLYAAGRQALIVGPTTPIVGKLIALGSLTKCSNAMETLSAEFDVAPQSVRNLTARLHEMRLIG